jgi:protein-histidine pros-kinase
MKLLLKFNLVFIAVFVAGLAAVGAITQTLLESHAREEVLQHARFLLEKASAVRSYTSTQVAPLLETQMKYGFLPQSVPAFSATEVLTKLQKAFPDYSYKEATLNPTNPRDRALAWESDVIGEFKKLPESKEFIGTRDTPSGPALYIARPIRVSDGACLRCHSTVDAAPRTLVEKYGPSNGFGWQLHEVVGAQVVSVPMAVPLSRSRTTWWRLMMLVSAVFAVTGAALNALLWAMVIRPVTRMAVLAERVSLGELDVPAFNTKGRDEIGVLARAFTRMRRSLTTAVSMLQQQA